MRAVTIPAILVMDDGKANVTAKVVLSKINYWYEINNECYIVLDNGDEILTDLDFEQVNLVIEAEEKA